MVWRAFRDLYPDKCCRCQWVEKIPPGDDGENVYGRTTFAPDGTVYVEVEGTMTVMDAIEVLAHELAHVAAGADAHHGEAWERAFEAIYEAYNEMGPENMTEEED